MRSAENNGLIGHIFETARTELGTYKVILLRGIDNKTVRKVGRGGAIGKTRGSESDDRSPLVSGSNPVAATFAFANLRKLAFRRLQKS